MRAASRPSRSTRPRSGASKPEASASSVDLPAPFGPTITVRPPRFATASTPSSAPETLTPSKRTSHAPRSRRRRVALARLARGKARNLPSFSREMRAPCQ